MKLICFIIALFPIVVFGQQKVIKTDTTILYKAAKPENWNGPSLPKDSVNIWYMRREVVYTDGTGDSPFAPIGDSLAVFDFYKNLCVDEARQVGQAAALVIERAQVIRAYRTRRTALLNVGLGDLQAGLDSLYYKEYLNPKTPSNGFLKDYDVYEATTLRAGTMRRLNNGNYRLSFNAKNYRILFKSENWATINDYPSNGLSIDIFRTSKREWKSVSGTNDGAKFTPTLTLVQKN